MSKVAWARRSSNSISVRSCTRRTVTAAGSPTAARALSISAGSQVQQAKIRRGPRGRKEKEFSGNRDGGASGTAGFSPAAGGVAGRPRGPAGAGVALTLFGAADSFAGARGAVPVALRPVFHGTAPEGGRLAGFFAVPMPAFFLADFLTAPGAAFLAGPFRALAAAVLADFLADFFAVFFAVFFAGFFAGFFADLAVFFAGFFTGCFAARGPVLLAGSVAAGSFLFAGAFFSLAPLVAPAIASTRSAFFIWLAPLIP